MELEKLCSKIIDDAEKTASDIIEDANKKAVSMISSAEKEYLEKNEKLKADAVVKAKDIHDKILESVDIEAKKEILSKKHKLIEKAFSASLNKLSKLSFTEYEELLKKKASLIKEKAEVKVLKQFDNEITDELLKKINPLLSKAKSFSDSGFQFIMENSILSFDFEEIIERLSHEKDAEVSAVLFS